MIGRNAQFRQDASEFVERVASAADATANLGTLRAEDKRRFGNA